MCLSCVYQGKKKAKVLAGLPKSGYYWKVVSEGEGKYWPYFGHGGAFKIGWNNVKPRYMGFGYKVGFHAYRYKPLGDIRCKIEKKDIIAIGQQHHSLVIVTKRIWIPKPK